MKINQAFKLNEVAGEYMLVNTGDRAVNLSTVFRLNETAAWLWGKIGEESFSEEMLVNWLCDEYEVTREVAAEDVSAMVKVWKEYGMLKPDNE